MKTRFLFLLRLALFLFFFFFVSRLLFFAFQFGQTAQMGLGNFIGTFVHGLRHDASMAGYVLLVVSLLLVATFFVPGKKARPFMDVFVGICLLVFSLVVVADAELYRHWGFRMDASVLIYLNTPGDMMASLPLWQTILFFLFWLAYAAGFYWLYAKWAGRTVNTFAKGHWSSVPVFTFAGAAMILPIRGSLGIAPMNTGMVYFSKNLFVNHAAVNGVWNFFYDWTNADRTQLKVNLMGPDAALALRQQWIARADSSQRVLVKPKPNVIFIILEGFSSKVIEPLGGRPGIAPRINGFWKTGIGFTNIYASGARSDRGLVALLSGYPSHPRASAMKYPKKTEKLPSLFHQLARNGYSTSFYYGGDTDFANMRSFLINSGAQRVVNGDDLPKGVPSCNWGAHDEVMFDRLFAETDTAKAPFFKVLFTLSSHEPFDVPFNKIHGNQAAEMYLNSVAYADSCLGCFIDKARQRSWWENTLVVLVADHSVPYLDGLTLVDPDRYTIPMLWLGGAVGEPLSINAIGNQTDLAATVLNQLGIESSAFSFSNDLLNPQRKDFAYYIYNRGFGVILPQGKFRFDLERNEVTPLEGDTTGLVTGAKGVFQNMIDDFNKL